MDGDLDDEEWHEDTEDWKQKERKHVKLDPSDISSILKQAEGGLGMQMCFVFMKEGFTAEKVKTLATQWQGSE